MTGLAGIILASSVGWLVVVTLALQGSSAICSSGGLLSQTIPHAMSVFGMWLAMAFAMMLPSTSSEIVHVTSAHSGRWAKWMALHFGSGYLAIALLVGLLAAVLQSVFEPIGILTADGKFANPTTAGLILLVVGFGELSSLVANGRQSDRTRSLADYSSPFLQGLCHGRSTLPRCFAMIGLQFVGGAMNLTWMATLTLWMFLHATLPWKRHMGAIASVAFLTAAGMTLFSLKT
jgi:predicted metal-binding membrane protein